MAFLRELLVRGGRAYVDSADVAAVLVRGDDFAAVTIPETPIRLLLSGCGETVDIFGISVEALFSAPKGHTEDWLDPDKFERLRVEGGHTFVSTRHVVGILMTGDNDQAPSTSKAPLRVIIRGAQKPIVGWGPTCLNFMFALQRAGRKVKVGYINPPAVAA